ncbi:MAG TPA: type II toxin-antitoxin system HicA family toxin [Candidatus Coprenecus stercoravium]|uniref:Type II toxin-antitoxin system HicA family toxin n=1 Tax=Candidatus Coprenecus stercoravium TaxID=2840735 RepID=A0A9D2GQL3_9BACT|nr:type II toxin-antitoxin system HicA family toxin [Candidatus Coprenecus stercoravium]
MKWNEFEKLARSKGWYCCRSGGNHDIYRHPERSGSLVIERHWSQEIRPGLMKRLLKQIGEE